MSKTQKRPPQFNKYSYICAQSEKKRLNHATMSQKDIFKKKLLPALLFALATLATTACGTTTRQAALAEKLDVDTTKLTEVEKLLLRELQVSKNGQIFENFSLSATDVDITHKYIANKLKKEYGYQCPDKNLFKKRIKEIFNVDVDTFQNFFYYTYEDNETDCYKLSDKDAFICPDMGTKWHFDLSNCLITELDTYWLRNIINVQTEYPNFIKAILKADKDSTTLVHEYYHYDTSGTLKSPNSDRDVDENIKEIFDNLYHINNYVMYGDEKSLNWLITHDSDMCFFLHILTQFKHKIAAKHIETFIPKSEKNVVKLKGDLNNDGADDYVLAYRGTIKILLYNKDKKLYEQVLANDNFVPYAKGENSEFCPISIRDDNYDILNGERLAIGIENGELNLVRYTTDNVDCKFFDFTYMNGDFYLTDYYYSWYMRGERSETIDLVKGIKYNYTLDGSPDGIEEFSDSVRITPKPLLKLADMQRDTEYQITDSISIHTD